MTKYVTFDDIEFFEEAHRPMCEEIYKHILSIEKKLLNEDIIVDKLSATYGRDMALKIVTLKNSPLYNALDALRITFLYFAGVNSENILNEGEKFDIFSLAKSANG